MKNIKSQPPFRYPGSKYRAFKYIKPFIDASVFDEYREPFLGGGGVFFSNCFDEKTIIWLNDYDKDLMNAYKTIQNPDGLEYIISHLNEYTPSKENFEVLKNENPTNKYKKATNYFLINRTAYSGIMNLPNWGFHPIKSVQPDKWPSRLIEANNKLQDCNLSSLDFEEVINAPASGNNVLLFLDPPYFAADQKRAYVKSFKLEDHIRLCECLKKTNYQFILTYDDCPEIREMYSWANIHEESWRYQTANTLKTTRKIGNELIITNF